MNINKFQSYNLHAHHGGFGLYNGKRTGTDGHNNAVRMLETARSRGFETYGLVAHLDFNRHIKFEGMKKYEGMTQFNDIEQAIIDYNKSAKAVRDAAKKVSGIKTLLGFEVDFYRGNDWLEDFNIIKSNLDFDFLIGSTHSLSNDNGTVSRNMYFIDNEDFTDRAIYHYYDNVKACIASGMFNFIAHIDLIRNFVPNYLPKFTKTIDDIIELLARYKMPTEINTSGFRKGLNAGFPEQAILNKMSENNIPVFISDDAHDTKSIGENFSTAAECLRKSGIKQYSIYEILGSKQR